MVRSVAGTQGSEVCAPGESRVGWASIRGRAGRSTGREKAKEKETIVLGGIIEEIRNIMTKKGDKMVFIKLADLSDSIEAVAFPKTFEKYKDILVADTCIAVKGRISERNGNMGILAEIIKKVT